MRRIIEGPPAPGETKAPLLKRLAWFAAIWVASLASVALASYLIRALIMPSH